MSNDHTEKTLKPSDTVFAGIPSGGPWSMTDIRDAIRRIAAYLDEQHAAQSAPPRLTEKPFFDGLAEHQRARECRECGAVGGGHRFECMTRYKTAAPPELAPGSREGSCSCMWPVAPDGPYHGVRCPRYRFHAIAQDSIPSADEGAETVARLGINVPKWADEICAKVASATEAAPLVEPPAPEAGGRKMGYGPGSRWIDEELSPPPNGAPRQRDSEEAIAAEMAAGMREMGADIDRLEKERDAALSQVEELKAELRKRDQSEASLRDDLDIAQTNAASFIGATSRAEAAEALLAEIRAVLVSRCWDAGSVKNEQLPGVVVSLLQSQSHLRTVSSAASERAESAEARIEALGEALESAHASRNALVQSGDESYHRAEVAEGRVKELEARLRDAGSEWPTHCKHRRLMSERCPECRALELSGPATAEPPLATAPPPLNAPGQPCTLCGGRGKLRGRGTEHDCSLCVMRLRAENLEMRERLTRIGYHAGMKFSDPPAPQELTNVVPTSTVPGLPK